MAYSDRGPPGTKIEKIFHPSRFKVVLKYLALMAIGLLVPAIVGSVFVTSCTPAAAEGRADFCGRKQLESSDLGAGIERCRRGQRHPA